VENPVSPFRAVHRPVVPNQTVDETPPTMTSTYALAVLVAALWAVSAISIYSSVYAVLNRSGAHGAIGAVAFVFSVGTVVLVAVTIGLTRHVRSKFKRLNRFPRKDAA